MNEALCHYLYLQDASSQAGRRREQKVVQTLRRNLKFDLRRIDTGTLIQRSVKAINVSMTEQEGREGDGK